MQHRETVRTTRTAMDTCVQKADRKALLVSCGLVLCAILAGSLAGYFMAEVAMAVMS